MTRKTTNTAAVTPDATPRAPKRIPRSQRAARLKDSRDAGSPRRTPLPTEDIDTAGHVAASETPIATTPDTTSGATPEPTEGATSDTDMAHDSEIGTAATGGSNGDDPVIPDQPEPRAAPGLDLGVSDIFQGANPDLSPEAIEAQSAKEARLSPEMRNAFLKFRKSKMAVRSSRAALAMSQLMRIRLPYPRQIEGMGELEELRLLGLEMRGDQQLLLSIFERTGCGKSTLAQQYRLMCNMEKPNSVLHARMGTSGTARDLWVSVMAELGDGFATAGNEHSLRRRAMKAMEDAGVELLILDETQHSGMKTGFSREVTAEIKIMLDTGLVPIVLMGTEKAVPLIAKDRELAGRMFAPCRLGPLEMTDDEDFELWCDLLQALDARMVSDRILDEPFGLDREEVAEALGEICEGIIGQLMRVMLMAVRNVARDGRTLMDMEDLALAVDEWSNELGFASTNPLRSL